MSTNMCVFVCVKRNIPSPSIITTHLKLLQFFFAVCCSFHSLYLKCMHFHQIRILIFTYKLIVLVFEIEKKCFEFYHLFH